MTDETVIVVRREAVAAVIRERRRWSAWWPDLDVTVLVDEGVEGMSWTVSGPIVGTSRVRLVPSTAGVVVHYSLAAEPTEPGSRATARRLPDSPHAQRALGGLQRRQAMAWKAAIWALKDELESGPA